MPFAQLEFSSLELEFDPIVPYDEGGRMEVTIFNKHPIPMEIFSLEFDRSVYRAGVTLTYMDTITNTKFGI